MEFFSDKIVVEHFISIGSYLLNSTEKSSFFFLLLIYTYCLLQLGLHGLKIQNKTENRKIKQKKNGRHDEINKKE